ncbi:glycosyltransferase family 2 protein [Crocinitomix catalasitica]|nr:glycosyltransferase family 2 protein [Crocinitomix catalasitica]
MDKLSVVIITLNEERNIGRAIRSVNNIADEILVLDSYSTDKTPEIVTELGAELIPKEWEGYSATKNFGNELCSNEYILSLDADEAVDEELANEILNLKQEGFKGVYNINRKTNYCGKWIRYSTWYPDWKYRIFPKSKAHWDGAYVHEELKFDESLKQIDLAGHLEHYSYYNYEEHRQRADKYSKLTARKLHERGKKTYLFEPYISGLGKFITCYILKLGILDGSKGFMIAQISAKSNVIKYKELQKLNRSNEN